jgi:hypothetical protein
MHFTKGAMPGYYTPDVFKGSVPALKRREHGKDIVWMSLTLMERESHMPHIEAATGHVLVMGLGMGMYLYNIIRKPDVTKVTVLERDPQVLQLLQQASDYLTWPGIEKVTVVTADALTWKSDEQFDYVYADFWKNMGDSKMGQWMAKVFANVPNAKVYGYWTMEFDYIDYLRELRVRPRHSTVETYAAWARTLGKPIVGVGSSTAHLYAVLAPIVQTMAKLVIQKDLFGAYTVDVIAREIIGEILHLRISDT